MPKQLWIWRNVRRKESKRRLFQVVGRPVDNKKEAPWWLFAELTTLRCSSNHGPLIIVHTRTVHLNTLLWILGAG